MMFGRNLLKSLATAAVLAVMAGGAQAATTFTSCVGAGYNISTKVSGAYDCTISDIFQDNVNAPLVVNTDPGFFGITSWSFLGKDESNTAIGQSGTYNFSALVAGISGTLGQLMLVFKDGDGTTLVGYLVNTTSGTWSTPFVSPPFSFNGNANSKDVSHISAYYTVAPVPVPAAGLLLLGALGGLAALRRRRAV